MDKEENEIKNRVQLKLAEFLGIDKDDVEDDFSLTEDLHMKPTDLTDFIEILSEMGFNTNRLDFGEIDTFSDLIEALTLN